MEHTIANADLKAEDIPPAGAGWGQIAPFALTFDGYEYHGSFDRCAEVGNRWADAYAERRAIPESLAELRTCLFWQQRCAHWADTGGDEWRLTYVRALVEAIRRKVLAGETE